MFDSDTTSFKIFQCVRIKSLQRYLKMGFLLHMSVLLMNHPHTVNLSICNMYKNCIVFLLKYQCI
jgi:hypothetical protein